MINFLVNNLNLNALRNKNVKTYNDSFGKIKRKRILVSHFKFDNGFRICYYDHNKRFYIWKIIGFSDNSRNCSQEIIIEKDIKFTLDNISFLFNKYEQDDLINLCYQNLNKDYQRLIKNSISNIQKFKHSSLFQSFISNIDTILTSLSDYFKFKVKYDDTNLTLLFKNKIVKTKLNLLTLLNDYSEYLVNNNILFYENYFDFIYDIVIIINENVRSEKRIKFENNLYVIKNKELEKYLNSNFIFSNLCH